MSNRNRSTPASTGFNFTQLPTLQSLTPATNIIFSIDDSTSPGKCFLKFAMRVGNNIYEGLINITGNDDTSENNSKKLLNFMKDKTSTSLRLGQVTIFKDHFEVESSLTSCGFNCNVECAFNLDQIRNDLFFLLLEKDFLTLTPRSYNQKVDTPKVWAVKQPYVEKIKPNEDCLSFGKAPRKVVTKNLDNRQRLSTPEPRLEIKPVVTQCPGFRLVNTQQNPETQSNCERLSAYPNPEFKLDSANNHENSSTYLYPGFKFNSGTPADHNREKSLDNQTGTQESRDIFSDLFGKIKSDPAKTEKYDPMNDIMSVLNSLKPILETPQNKEDKKEQPSSGNGTNPTRNLFDLILTGLTDPENTKNDMLESVLQKVLNGSEKQSGLFPF